MTYEEWKKAYKVESAQQIKEKYEAEKAKYISDARKLKYLKQLLEIAQEFEAEQNK